MKPGKLIIRNLIFFWRTNLAIVAGVAIAIAVLSGALQVGQSVRDSLRHLLFERIGSADYILSSNNFFDEKLAEELHSRFESCPIIYLKGIVIHEKTQVRVQNVNVYGIDERFWKFHGMADQPSPADRSALVGSGLARQLDITNRRQSSAAGRDSAGDSKRVALWTARQCRKNHSTELPGDTRRRQTRRICLAPQPGECSFDLRVAEPPSERSATIVTSQCNPVFCRQGRRRGGILRGRRIGIHQK